MSINFNELCFATVWCFSALMMKLFMVNFNIEFIKKSNFKQKKRKGLKIKWNCALVNNIDMSMLMYGVVK